jgi:transposase
VKCKNCGSETKIYDVRTNNKRHTVTGGKTIYLRIKKHRVKCKKCGKVFVEPIKGVSRSGFTDHMIQQMQEKSRGQDYSTVAREMGVGCATVCRKVLELPVAKFKTPKKKN